MTDTLWTDTSQFQRVPDDSYPYRVISLRSNDGGYHDPIFHLSHEWAVSALNRGTLDIEIVYAVYRPDNGNWATTLMNNLTPHPRLAVMPDVESWNGAIIGDHSDDINAGVERLAAWAGGLERVLGYANPTDYANLWPRRALAPKHEIVAAYGWNPKLPDQLVHQFTDAANVPPFGGPVDLNSADGYDIPALLAALGMSQNPTPIPPPVPPTLTPPPFPLPSGWWFGWEAGPVQSVSGYHGHRGDLAVWQQRMRDRGWQITVDGLYGPQTNGVCLSFQREKGLVADGKIGPVTWAAAWTLPVT